jgi:hypothetical protein
MQPKPNLIGSVEYCPRCKKNTAHLCSPGGWPVCGRCGAVNKPKGGR